MNFIDSHFHIPCMLEKDVDVDSALRFISSGISICLSQQELSTCLKYQSLYPNLHLAVGFGPWTLDEQPNKSINDLINDFKSFFMPIDFEFVGEIGLDYFHDYATKEKQQELMIAQIEVAKEINKPIIIHNRDANEITKNILVSQKNPKAGIIHCFSADLDFARTVLDLGYYVSFAGNLTYKKNTNLQEALKFIPSDRLLLETDAPYMSPVPNRGKLNSPANMIYIYEFASKLKNLSLEDLCIQIEKNFNALLCQ